MLLLCLVFLFHGVRAAYEEKLMLRPLEDINQFLARFKFVVDEAFDLDDGASLFPNVLRHLLEKYDICGLALDLNSSGLAHAPFGARLQVALIGDADVQHRWRGITSEMSGILSASQNEMDETVVTRLLSSSIPQELGAFPVTNADPREVLFHGSLAGEELCTENLTPWLMMLPCRTITGIGSLIDPLDALSGEYISLSLFASRLSDGGLMLQQDLTTSALEAWLPILWKDSKHDISACPLADKSAIHMADLRSVVTTDFRKEAVLFPILLFENLSYGADGGKTS
ncbi:hypothetical protein PsorP6_017612 [Peronosclerospora sorghi]|uniref:Uncharacterized protein n=1 Tax=Peronosclerospora sorghi TaxID=230839 RepID=A0ACC0WLJ2_9STRA|nr:hypothetical protein PsorP6_017612 [Peronosclerospora sorghi]